LVYIARHVPHVTDGVISLHHTAECEKDEGLDKAGDCFRCPTNGYPTIDRKCGE
jgi:hypothetical protein